MNSRALCLVIAKVRVRFLVNNELPLFIRTNQERLSEQLLHYRFILPRRSCSLWYLFSLTLTFKTSCSVVNEYFRGVNRAFFGSLPTQIPFKVNIIAKSTLQTIHLSAHNLIFLIENYAFLWEHLTQLDFFRIFWNVEICLYFEPPFVLVLRRMPLENKGAVTWIKELWRNYIRRHVT